MKKITTVILAAGKSSRFRHNKSKIFHDLAGLSIIDHVFNLAFKVSKNDIIFVCNDQNIDKLRQKFPKVKFVIQKNQRGTADAILYAKKFLINKNILVLFGDVPLITISSINKLKKSFYKNESIGSMLAFIANNPFGYGRVTTLGKKVTSVIEELNTKKFEKKINLCNSGVMMCNANLLFKHINKISENNIKKEKYLPDIFSIFNSIKKNFYHVLVPKSETLGINKIKDLIELDQIFQSLLKEKLINSGVIIQNPDSVRVSFDTKIKKGSIIESFVQINPSVKIFDNVFIKSHTVLEGCIVGENSIIGPSARIRPKTKIGKSVKIGNYVEIKNSEIGNNCSISHLSYIGDSKLGNNVNIGAGTITCNYDGKKKNITVIKNNVFVGSNSSLVAPITIGKNSTIGAGSVITRNIPSNHLAVERSNVRILRKPVKK